MLAIVKSLLPARFYALALSLAVFLGSIPAAVSHRWVCAVAAIAGTLALIGLRDMMQQRQSIRRNYPILGHLRFFLEYLRPAIRQYFFEDDTQEAPFSRNQRSIVYQRAKDVLDKRPFGTQRNVYESGYEWINHSMLPAKVDTHDFRVSIGGDACSQPYNASVFNISAMSFGALSANAILALNRGAKLGHFAHDTGEGQHQPLSPRVWRRSDLGTRQRLFRLPRR